MDALERCNSRVYSKEALLGWMTELDCLHCMLWVATGWQPGMDLLAATREEFSKAVARQHGDPGHPLLSRTPQQCIDECRQALGVAAKLAFTLDVCVHTGQQFISDGKFSVRLPVVPGGSWQLQAPPAGQGPEWTVVTDGKHDYLASSMLSQHYVSRGEQPPWQQHQQQQQQQQTGRGDLSTQVVAVQGQGVPPQQSMPVGAQLSPQQPMPPGTQLVSDLPQQPMPPGAQMVTGQGRGDLPQNASNALPPGAQLVTGQGRGDVP